MRIRLRHTKLGKVRFLGHRDLARVLERGLRKAGIRVAYTEGFSPRPKVHFGLALPTGCESVAEYVDVDLFDGGPDGAVPAPGDLSEVLPGGIDVTASGAIDRSEPSLQEAVSSCSWEIRLPGIPIDGAREAAATALAADSIPLERTRKGRTSTDDVRPYLLALQVDEGAGGEVVLLAELGTKPRGLRPTELLEVIGGPAVCRVRRTSQWISSGGAKREPLPLAATRTAHAHERAS